MIFEHVGLRDRQEMNEISSEGECGRWLTVSVRRLANDSSITRKDPKVYRCYALNIEWGRGSTPGMWNWLKNVRSPGLPQLQINGYQSSERKIEVQRGITVVRRQ